MKNLVRNTFDTLPPFIDQDMGNPSHERKLRQKRYVDRRKRLAAFRGSNLNEIVPMSKLADSGFLPTDNVGELWCPWCNLTVKDIPSDFDPLAYHRANKKVDCPFLSNYSKYNGDGWDEIEYPGLSTTDRTEEHAGTSSDAVLSIQTDSLADHVTAQHAASQTNDQNEDPTQALRANYAKFSQPR